VRELAHRTKVTIGLVVKNDEASIKGSLESILTQELPHELMELIVVDGKSQDATLSIIKRTLLGAELRFSIFEEQAGLAFARQIVVDNSEGEYIIWVDGDMMFPKGYFTRMVEFMDQNPNVGIAAGNFKMSLMRNSSVVYKLAYLEKEVENHLFQEGNQALVGTGGSIFRKEALLQVGGFDTKIMGAGEDVELAYRMALKGWKLWNVRNEFYDVKESKTGWKDSWKGVWKHYCWYGYNYHYVYSKHPEMFALYFKDHTPIYSLFGGFRCMFLSFRLTRNKLSLLLPLLVLFRQLGWTYAYMRAHLAEYSAHL
jgi:glycosyltransferase involved in cell wall biosynthesis